jgi:hypothetical protein
VVAIMAFYPAAQTLGQLSTAALKATEKTAIYARWSILLSIPDLALVWFLLAPASATIPGLNLGAEGMAIRTALFGLASVHVFDWINCRSMGIPYAGVLRRRFAALLALGAISFVTLHLAGAAARVAGASSLTALLGSSFVYAIAIAALVWFAPGLLGLPRERILAALRRVKP